ncbi:MAG: DNA polymerase III subunit beta [Saprospiraceae bacterium]
MKFSVSSAELLKHLQIASGAIGSNPVLPILEDFLFHVKGKNLTITATDLETTVKTEMEIKSDQNGAIAIPAKILNDTLKSLPEQPVSFTVDAANNSIEITSSYGRYRLAGENPGDFPSFPSSVTQDTFKINSDILHEAFNKTLFATSNDELRLAMTGILVQLDFSKVLFVSTDAHKLVKYVFHGITNDVATQFILPKKTCNLLKNTLPANTEVEISFNKSNAFFAFGNTLLACRLLDAKYPDYNGVIPVDNPNMLTVNRTQLLQSLRRIAIYANKTTNQVALHIDDGSLTISSQDLDFSNEATEQLACTFKGSPLMIAFNGKFLIEMLSVMTNDEVTFRMSTPNRAGIVTPTEDIKDQDLTMLIMPVLINQAH